MLNPTNLENSLAYEKRDFGDKSLGEVVAMLNCLQTEQSEQCSTDIKEQVSKKRLLARWNNTTSIARIKHLV